MKLDKRHKWASYEEGELVFWECVVCGEERTETTLERDLRLSIEAEKEKKKQKKYVFSDYLFPSDWPYRYSPLPSQPGSTITFARLPRIELGPDGPKYVT